MVPELTLGGDGTLGVGAAKPRMVTEEVLRGLDRKDAEGRDRGNATGVMGEINIEKLSMGRGPEETDEWPLETERAKGSEPVVTLALGSAITEKTSVFTG